MNNHNDVLNALGELFIIGFNGLELAPETSEFLSKAKIGGVLLFSHNFENPAQLAELTNQIQEARSHLPLWVGVDHEGGRVQRFKKVFTRIPDAAAIGATNSPKLAFEIAELMAKELKSVGINLNFCPVLDIATNPKNPVIGNRAFGSTEEIVSKMGSAMMRGHLVHGIQPCVKHFPGHGDTNTDSHFALPKVDTTLEALQQRELQPFVKAFKAKCTMLMTAHIIMSKIDPKFPATLSKIILQDILRKQLRYSKVIVSDDMEMKAIADHFGAEDAPRMALQAGCDLLIYRTEAAARIAYESLVKALESGALNPEQVLQSAHRNREVKKQLLPSYHPVSVSDVGRYLGGDKHQEIVDRVLRS